MVLGLTGTYCAGKNYVASVLEQRGLPVLDLDAVGHQALESEKESVVRFFGPGVLWEDATINRVSLGKLVFADPEKRALLERIVHPVVNQRTIQWIEDQPESCVINAALLHKSAAFSRLGAIILVEAPVLLRFFRARRRDHLPWKDLMKRFWSQRHFRSQYFSSNADVYIMGNGFLHRKKIDLRVDEILLAVGL
ncbi:hypothetical protein FACS1894172_14070 [Spirochaetia bacterium]|nr:hypothetical protein FACS1894164_13550 [Spirochaetia bacterium]GHU34178.1 hypothetical protein FACS1894172_14070 [Spirochaetia bacterium]